MYKSFLTYDSKFDDDKGLKLKDLNLDDIEIEFKNVSFQYSNSTFYVLKNINLKLSSKEKLAVVGYNGAGKTTFTLLLTRMYEPTEGEILLNGINSTRFCDKIAVFDHGQIKEYGTFEELMNLHGLYYTFFETQAELYVRGNE